VLRVACRRERVRAAGKQLDPVRAPGDLIAHRLARVFGTGDDGTFERIAILRRRGITDPADAERRHLVARAVDAALVDRIADRDVAVAVAVRAHVARAREAGAQ